MEDTITYKDLILELKKNQESLQKQLQDYSELRLQVIGALEFVDTKIKEFQKKIDNPQPEMSTNLQDPAGTDNIKPG